MKQDHIKLVIPAYTTFRGGGLMHFLFQAIPALALARPHWTFEIIGSIALLELERLKSANVHLTFWDGDTPTRVIYQIGSQILKWFGKESQAGFLLQKRAEMAGIPWGQAANRLAPMQQANAIWVPNYNIALNQISLYGDLQNTKAPVLFTIHDIHPAFYPDDHPADDLARFYQGFVPLAQRCQRIFTHSQFQKSAITRLIQVSAEKIYVTSQPPLINPQILLQACAPAQITKTFTRWGIKRPYAFYPASTTHLHKNHTRLLVAWAQLKRTMGQNCPLLVCTGRGSRRQFQRLTDLVTAFDLHNDVLFTGPVDTASLASLFQNCALVVIPTLYEGAGSGILTDALVAGKPVACADIPQVREQIAALGPIVITTFDPQNSAAIACAVQSILSNLDDQQLAAQKNQALAQTGFFEMWRTWAEDYAKCIEAMLQA